MSSINQIVLCGNVGADADVKTLENGTKVARFRMATSMGGIRNRTARMFRRERNGTR